MRRDYIVTYGQFRPGENSATLHTAAGRSCCVWVHVVLKIPEHSHTVSLQPTNRESTAHPLIIR